MTLDFESLAFYTYVGITLSIIALAGALLIKRDFITILISIELLLLVSIILLLVYTYFLQVIEGELFILLILVIAAAESSILLAAIYNFYGANKRVDMLALEL